MNKSKDKKWLLWVLLIFLPPIGIVYMWIIEKEFTQKTKIILSVVFSFWFIILISSFSGNLVDTNTPKSTELSEKYSFYEKSVNNIRVDCNVTPEQADEIFLILVDNCGVSDLINYVFKNNDGTFSMYSSGTNYNVALKDGIVSTVSVKHLFSDEQLYPKIENAQANNKPSEPTTTKPTQPETQTQEPTSTEEATTEAEPIINEENNENDSNNNAEANESNNDETEPYITATTSANVFTYVLNTSTKKFHVPSCSDVKKIKNTNYSEYTGTYDEVTSMGYVACKRCHPH